MSKHTLKSSAASDRDASPPRVLLVDDEPLNLDLLEQELDGSGCEVVTASNGEEALELVSIEAPDLIIMDMSLPVLDGWSATQAIRTNPETADIPIIALSAHAMDADKQRALQAGCNAYLTKPVDERLLFKTIADLMEADV